MSYKPSTKMGRVVHEIYQIKHAISNMTKEVDQYMAEQTESDDTPDTHQRLAPSRVKRRMLSAEDARLNTLLELIFEEDLNV